MILSMPTMKKQAVVSTTGIAATLHAIPNAKHEASLAFLPATPQRMAKKVPPRET